MIQLSSLFVGLGNFSDMRENPMQARVAPLRVILRAGIAVVASYSNAVMARAIFSSGRNGSLTYSLPASTGRPHRWSNWC